MSERDRETIIRDLGLTIRRRRTQLLLSQEGAASRARTAMNYLGQIERGESAVTVPLLVRIAEALETDASTLLREAGL